MIESDQLEYHGEYELRHFQQGFSVLFLFGSVELDHGVFSFLMKSVKLRSDQPFISEFNIDGAGHGGLLFLTLQCLQSRFLVFRIGTITCKKLNRYR